MPTPVEGEPFYRRHGMPATPGSDIRIPEGDGGQALAAAFSQLRKAAHKAVFVSKRTANNRRLGTIDRIFPGASYINLKRDGREVAASLSRVEWWHDHPLWWDPQQRTPSQLQARGEDMLRLCAHNWVAETEVIARGLAQIDASRVLEIRFERILASPVAEMDRVLDFLGLAQNADYSRAIASMELSVRPGDWRQAWNADQIAMVNREQAPQLAHQGYVR
jgi:hypothetical protein